MVADYKTVPYQFYVNVSDDAEKVEEIFPTAEIIHVKGCTAFITEKISENELGEKLSGFTVNSVLRAL